MGNDYSLLYKSQYCQLRSESSQLCATAVYPRTSFEYACIINHMQKTFDVIS